MFRRDGGGAGGPGGAGLPPWTTTGTPACSSGIFGSHDLLWDEFALRCLGSAHEVQAQPSRRALFREGRGRQLRGPANFARKCWELPLGGASIRAARNIAKQANARPGRASRQEKEWRGVWSSVGSPAEGSKRAAPLAHPTLKRSARRTSAKRQGETFAAQNGARICETAQANRAAM